MSIATLARKPASWFPEHPALMVLDWEDERSDVHAVGTITHASNAEDEPVVTYRCACGFTTPECATDFDATASLISHALHDAPAGSESPRRPQVGDLIAYAHPTQHRTLIGTIVRLEGEVPHIRLKGSRTVFECLSGEGVEILSGHDPEPAPACPDCQGAGTDWWHKCGCAHGCSMCDGAGHNGVFACPTCKGSGDAPTS